MKKKIMQKYQENTEKKKNTGVGRIAYQTLNYKPSIITAVWYRCMNRKWTSEIEQSMELDPVQVET